MNFCTGFRLSILTSRFLGVYAMLQISLLLTNLMLVRVVYFLGYPLGSKGYLIYDLNNHKINTSGDVLLNEHIFPFAHLPHED